MFLVDDSNLVVEEDEKGSFERLAEVSRRDANDDRAGDMEDERESDVDKCDGGNGFLDDEALKVETCGRGILISTGPSTLRLLLSYSASRPTRRRPSFQD